MTDRSRPSRSGSNTRQRTRAFPVRLSEAERAELEAAASAAGMTAGSYLRHLLTAGKAPRSVRRPPVELEALRVLLGELGLLRGELGKIGSNLNQIAYKLNIALPVLPGQLQETLRNLDLAFLSLQAKRDAALSALGFEVAE
jgi:chemotaxis protein histidine kinase CheA